MSKPKRVVLEGFVEDYPDKAVDILMKCCHEPDIAKEIVDFLLDQRLNATYTISDNNASIAPNPKTSNISQRPGSFSSHRQQPSHSIPGVEAHTDSPSPPTTRSDHSRSLSGKDGKENILILATNEDDDIEKHPATMKLAPIEYSVIGQHMFTAGRICESNIKAIEEEQISVPQRGVPGALRQITVSSRAELTWKRSISNASHRTTFFLVAQEFLDTDLLLGSLDSGEGMYSWPHACTLPGLTHTTHTDRPDMPDTILSPPQQGQGLNFNEHAECHHRSSNAYDGSKNPTHSQPDEVLQQFARNRREQVAVQSRPAPAAASNQRTDSSRNHRPPASGSTSSSHTAIHNAGSDRIRVSCTLGSSALSFWLDLDASAQAFFVTIQQNFDKKRNSLDRATTSILFTRDKQTPHDGGRELLLSEDEMEADWEETMAWIRENKKQKPPHIYATLQYDES
jgi:hypothetical protein